MPVAAGVAAVATVEDVGAARGDSVAGIGHVDLDHEEAARTSAASRQQARVCVAAHLRGIVEHLAKTAAGDDVTRPASGQRLDHLQQLRSARSTRPTSGRFVDSARQADQLVACR